MLGNQIHCADCITLPDSFEDDTILLDRSLGAPRDHPPKVGRKPGPQALDDVDVLARESWNPGLNGKPIEHSSDRGCFLGFFWG